jgi:hypothetical protein
MMGTDIHMAAEVAVYDENGERTGWKAVPGPIIDCWGCAGTGISHGWENGERVPTGDTCRWCAKPELEEDNDYEYLGYRMTKYVEPGKERDRWYSERNYTVFAVLADVRNGAGFAGVYTHDPIKPIDYPRGLPDDIVPETRAILSDEHSQTWLSLAEIMAYDWDQTMRRGGCVTLDEYRTYIQTGRPESWSGDVWGNHVRKVSLDEANALLAAGEYPPDTYVHITWTQSLRDSIGDFIERMQMLMMETGEAEVRLVFDFDS